MIGLILCCITFFSSVSDDSWVSSVEKLKRGEISPGGFVEIWKAKVGASRLAGVFAKLYAETENIDMLSYAIRLAISSTNLNLLESILEVASSVRSFNKDARFMAVKIAGERRLRNLFFSISTNSNSKLLKNLTADVIINSPNVGEVVGMFDWSIDNYPPVAAFILRNALKENSQSDFPVILKSVKSRWFKMNIVSVSPDFPYLLAELFLKTKSPMMEWLLSLFPDDVEINLMAGKMFLQSENLHRAIDVLERFSGKDTRVDYLLSVAYFLDGEVDKANKIVGYAVKGRVKNSRRVQFLIELYKDSDVSVLNRYPLSARDIFVSFLILSCTNREVQKMVVDSEMWLLAGNYDKSAGVMNEFREKVQNEECRCVASFLEKESFDFIGVKSRKSEFCDNGKGFWDRYAMFLKALDGDTNSIMSLVSREDLWMFLFMKK